MRGYAKIGLLTALVLAAACSPPFPKQVMDQVDRNVSFSDLRKDPQMFTGRWLLLAGAIETAKAEKDGSTSLEIVQKPADREGRPELSDETGGRFIAISRAFLDPAVYRTGRPITIVGRVLGDTVRPLGELNYRYPLLEVEALHLWPPSSGPRYSIGIGVGIFHGY